MRRFGRRRVLTCIAALATVAVPAAAGDPPPAGGKDDKPRIEGDLRTGWRFLSGEGEGRFQQDQGLADGPRIFDLNLLGTDPRDRAPIDEAEAHLSGIGDRNSDYVVSLRKRDVFDLSGGLRRDDSTYTATSDPFSYDTLRERSFVHGRWTPNRDLAVRLSWDRSDRSGDSDGAGFSKIVPLQQPAVTSPQSFPQSRRFSQRTDDFTLGVDWSPGIFRFGVTQSLRIGKVDDSRSLRTTSSGVHLFDDVDLSTRSKSWVTTAKAGAVVLDGKLDATLFVTRIASPLEARATGDSLGVDTDGNPKPVVHFDTDSDVHRHDLEWRLETSWRPHRDWEFTAAGESGNLVDEETADRSANFFASEKPVRSRIVDRTRRWSFDATWDAAEHLRLRAGEQHLDEVLLVPGDSHFNRLIGTELRSDSWRTTLGADWDPVKTLSLGALAHHSSNDAPQTTAVPEQSNDWTLRGRWRPSGEVTVTTVWRHVAAVHSGAVHLVEIGQLIDTRPPFFDHALETRNFGSASRTDSWSASASWTREPWTLRGTATYRRFDTSADTAFNRDVVIGPVGNEETVHRKLFETVGFSGRDIVVNVDLRREIGETLRVFAGGTGTDARGDYAARWLQASLGGEYDLRKYLTLGLTLSTWRLVERHRGADDYRTYGAEFSVTWHF